MNVASVDGAADIICGYCLMARPATSSHPTRSETDSFGPIEVPADADFVIEGYVDNEDLRVEGTFGDRSGDLSDLLHEVTASH